MAQYDPIWSYGGSVVITSSGETVDEGEDTWSYGQSVIRHEWAVDEVPQSRSKRGLLLGVW